MKVKQGKTTREGKKFEAIWVFGWRIIFEGKVRTRVGGKGEVKPSSFSQDKIPVDVKKFFEFFSSFSLSVLSRSFHKCFKIFIFLSLGGVKKKFQNIPWIITCLTDWKAFIKSVTRKPRNERETQLFLRFLKNLNDE